MGNADLEECKERIEHRRELAAFLQPIEYRGQAKFVLETFERALALIEGYQRRLSGSGTFVFRAEMKTIALDSMSMCANYERLQALAID